MPSPWSRATALCFFAAGLFQATWFARLPSLSSDLALDASGLSLALFTFSLGGALGLLLGPGLYGRLGPRRSQLWAGLVMGPAVLVIGLFAGVFHSLAGLLAAVFVTAAAFGLYDVCMNISGANNEREIRRSLLPRLHALYSAGAIAGSLLAAAAIAIGLEIVPNFVLVGTITTGLTVWAARSAPDVAPGKATIEQEDKHQSRFGRIGAHLAEITQPWMWGLGVGLFLIAVAEGTGMNWIAYATEHAHGRSELEGTLSLVVFTVAIAVCRIFSGLVVDRVGRVAVLRVAISAAAVGLACYALGSGPLPVFGGAALWGLGVAVGFPLIISAAGEGNPATAPGRVSMVSFFGYGASFAGPPIIGVLGGIVGVLPSLLLIGGFLVVAVGLAGTAKSRPGHLATQPTAANR